MLKSSHSTSTPRDGLTDKALLALPFILLILQGAIKSDVDAILDSNYYSGLQISQLSIFIKDNLSILYISLLIAVIASFIKVRTIRISSSAIPILFSLVYLYAAIRTFFVDESLSYKFLLEFIIMGVVQIYLASLLASGRDIIQIIQHSFLFVAATLVGLNLLEYALGYGFIPGKARFFGISSHPNTLGIHMAFCAISAISYQAKRSSIQIIFKWSLVFGSLFLLYQSGSRSAILSFLIGYMFVYMIRNKISNSFILMIASASILTVAYLYGAIDSSLSFFTGQEVFDRGGSNTRAVAWGNLWTEVQQSPFIGIGELPWSSENSWLRGWASIGIIFPVILTICVIGTFYKCFLINTISNDDSPADLFGCFAVFTFGALFEGYLFDRNSLPIQAWFILLSAISIIALYDRLTLSNPRRAQAARLAAQGRIPHQRRTISR